MSAVTNSTSRSAQGAAFLDLDRVRALEAFHESGVHEDDVVGYYEYCRFGQLGAVPSIDIGEFTNRRYTGRKALSTACRSLFAALRF